MKLGIQEDMLPGTNILDKCAQAKAVGLDGIEVFARGLTERVSELAEALMTHDLSASAVVFGRENGLLHPNPAERERALAELRTAINNAADLGAAGVVFVPLFGDHLLPDLSPLKSAAELEVELLIMHLRGLEDYAGAMGVKLFIEPTNRYTSKLFNRVEQAALVARGRNHPSVRVLADTFHMAIEEADCFAALRDHADVIGHVHLADTNRRLPGQGMFAWKEVNAALRDANYDGWCVLECGTPGDNSARAAEYWRDLPACLNALRAAGW